MTQLFIEALDVWLFRDGRPFSPGSGSRAESTFPPYPTSVQGAVRSKYLTSQQVDLRASSQITATVGDPINYSGSSLNLAGLKICGPFVAVYNATTEQAVRYFPQPADAYSSKNAAAYKIKPASPPEVTPVDVLTCMGKDASLLGFQDEPTKGDSGLWLDQYALIKYLGGSEVVGVPARELFVKENRIGIGMQQDRRTVEEGLLYEVEFIRPIHQTGLLIEVAGYQDFPEEGILQLGGENRAGHFRKVKADSMPTIPNPLPKRFKVYFATPAYFESGYQPDTWDTFFSGGKVVLKTVALSRYESMGGYDWINEHRPGRRYVPSGSVYYFECQPGVSVKTDKLFTEFGAEIGFGQVIILEKEW